MYGGSGKSILFSPKRPDRLWGPPSLLYNGCRGAVSLVVKRQVREADHSPLSSDEAKNGGAIPPLICLHGVVFDYVTKYRDNFIFKTFHTLKQKPYTMLSRNLFSLGEKIL
jgi:hypothetical protein